MNTVYIYALLDPKTSNVRYIGKANDIQRRMYVHLADVTNTHKSRWIQSLLAVGLKPDIKVLEIIDNATTEMWQEREIFWIANYKNAGFDLTNLTDGGQGGPKGPRSSEVRARVSAAKVGILNPSAVLNESIVLDIRECAAKGISQAELAERFGVKRATISAIVTGRSWTKVGGPRSMKVLGPKSKVLQDRIFSTL